MSCDLPDLGTFVSEIEWLVKNHSTCILDNHERMKSRKKLSTTCKDRNSYTMNITLDVFAKLHQMLHNYIGLLNFRGTKSRDFECLKISLVEALDVAVRAMISAMQSCASKERSSAPVCRNKAQPSVCCSRCELVDANADCESDKLFEVQEVDKKLQRLKSMNLDSVDNVETYIKQILRDITKLPLAVMTSRLEILSSAMRNTKNKLTSRGQPSVASLMGTQVNPISQIISQFILEYGEMKSKIFPCKKICRFCSSVICPMDRPRDIFCCENAKRLNYLWKEWTRKNSLNGVAEWDEDTIISIVDSFRDNPVERVEGCVRRERSDTLPKTAGQQDSKRADLPDEKAKRLGSNENNQRRDRNVRHEQQEKTEQGKKISPHFPHGENERVDNPLASERGKKTTAEGESKNKIGRSRTENRGDSKDPGKESSFAENQNQAKGKRREIRSHSANSPSTDERRIAETSDTNKTDRKKRLKKTSGTASETRGTGKLGNLTTTAGEMGLDDEADGSGGGERKKGGKSGRGSEMRKSEGDRENNKRRDKRRGKKEGELSKDSSDHRIGNMGEPSGLEYSKKGRETKHSGRGPENSRGKDPRVSAEDPKQSHHAKGNGAKGSGPSKTGITRQKDNDVDPGTKAREKYYEYNQLHDGKRSFSTGEREVQKSGKDTLNHHGDCKENVIRYELSNELFIKLGWTRLPKDTVMRRVVEFQADLAKPHMNWLKNSKIHGKQYYADDKTVFIDFLEDGSGTVFYPNGQTAIAAHISKKGTHELYKVYAQGGRDVIGVLRLPWLMGVFDSMGNGVVYNENSEVRLSYNQNGGVYVDNPAKVPVSWGWNNFQTLPIDEAVYEEPLLDQIPPELIPPKEVKSSSSKTSKFSKSSKGRNSAQQLSAEVEASPSDSNQNQRNEKPVKVIPQKVLTPLKPICLKMNKYLSLRILDRKNINLQFFAGSKCVRIELGTEINPNVQIGSELVDHDDWTAKMTKSKFHLDLDRMELLNQSSPDNSLIEIAEEFQRNRNEANSRQLMIAKYKPQLISSDFNTSHM